uniref:Uncharacterized protein n=1 Tax=Denticeps clupeoides TaxID=299321 RepID=A0AAY4ENG2_9TELE
MVEQNKEASSTPSMQAGPAHGNNGVQVIRTVGRQLAQIGDELNQQWGDRLPQAHQNIRRSNTTLPQGLLVSAALVATAAVCIAFWELKKDFRL